MSDEVETRSQAAEAALAEVGRKLFAGEAEFLGGAGSLDGLPPMTGGI